jgi:hypothetical protein
MKKLLVIAALLLTGCSAIQDPYLKVGAGYKFAETNVAFLVNGKRVVADDPISARVELGANCIIENVTCGVTHRSQWFSGAPFNNDKEYSVTEFFAEYTYWFGR